MRKVESITMESGKTACPRLPGILSGMNDEFHPEELREFERLLHKPNNDPTGLAGYFNAGEVWVSRVPARLDVMGGIADYSGANVCESRPRRGILMAFHNRADVARCAFAPCRPARAISPWKRAYHWTISLPGTDWPSTRMCGRFAGQIRWSVGPPTLAEAFSRCSRKNRSNSPLVSACCSSARSR